MEIDRTTIQGRGFAIPCVIIQPGDPIGSAVIAHGYGGCKEEQLGLAWRIAEAGVTACAIDLRGHGQHPLPLDADVLDDVEAAVHHCRKYGKVAAIGHSLGGRLALISSADFAIGISPPLAPDYGARTMEALEKFRSYRVRPNDPGVVFDAVRRMPLWQTDRKGRTMIIFGSRDVPEIVSSCNELKNSGGNVVRLDQAHHGDTYLLESSFRSIVAQLEAWFGEEPRS